MSRNWHLRNRNKKTLRNFLLAFTLIIILQTSVIIMFKCMIDIDSEPEKEYITETVKWVFAQPSQDPIWYYPNNISDFETGTIEDWAGTNLDVTTDQAYEGSYSLEPNWALASYEVDAAWINHKAANNFPRKHFLFPLNTVNCTLRFWHRPSDTFPWEDAREGYYVDFVNETTLSYPKFDVDHSVSWIQTSEYNITDYIASNETRVIYLGFMVKKSTGSKEWCSYMYLDYVELKYTYFVIPPITMYMPPIIDRIIHAGLFLGGFLMFGIPFIIMSYRGRERTITAQQIILYLFIMLIGLGLMIR